ncbi:MAG: hypothetical protein ONB16_11435 [candidate division KSB1 bacterium]|nr:hypothetical protein [candidate division KSB1 bacterium]
MGENNEKIFDSSELAPDDAFWLAYGRQMISESLPAVRSAATAMMTAVGVMEAIYVGILGLDGVIATAMPLWQKALFAIPLVIWVAAMYCCVNVLMTRKLMVQLFSPDDIREQSLALVQSKQRQLQWAYWLLVIGLVTAIGLFIGRV